MLRSTFVESGWFRVGRTLTIAGLACTLLPVWAGLSGCTSPAKPRGDAGLAPAVGTALGAGASQKLAAIDGVYIATIHTTLSGPVRAVMTAERTERTEKRGEESANIDGFKANTRPNVAWSFVSGVESLLQPVLGPFVFPNGMLLTWDAELVKGDGPTGEVEARGTIGFGVPKALRAQTRQNSTLGPVEITYETANGRMRTVAAMTLEPAAGVDPAKPMCDYPGLVSAMRPIVEQYLFDPELARSDSMQKYFAQLESAAARTNDDLEFLFAGALAARTTLSRSAPFLYPAPNADSAAKVRSAATAAPGGCVVERDGDGRFAVLRCDAFSDSAEVEAALATAIEKSEGLVIDLRSSVGFDLSSLLVASAVVSEPVRVGTLVPGPLRAEYVNTEGRAIEPFPAAAESVSIDSGASVAASESRLSGARAADILVTPHPTLRFSGPVKIVTSRRTSATAELLVWALKGQPNVEVIGERTAGRARLSRTYPLRSAPDDRAWVVRIAAYELMVAGEDLSKGIKADRGMNSEDAVKYALKRLRDGV